MVPKSASSSPIAPPDADAITAPSNEGIAGVGRPVVGSGVEVFGVSEMAGLPMPTGV
jgi:hypothetical protein